MTHIHARTPRHLGFLRLALTAGLFGSAGLLSGCNDAQAGLLLGAGAGALAGQAIGHSTEATLIGTAVGAGAGYVIGNESDKDRHSHHGHGNGNYDY